LRRWKVSLVYIPKRILVAKRFFKQLDRDEQNENAASE
jgi:hypothetical protein